MKKAILISLVLMLQIAVVLGAEKEYPAYYKVTSSNESIEALVKQTTNALTQKGFEVIGEYQPGQNNDLYVLAYTRKDLQTICLDFEDRGALASVLKVGFQAKDGKTDVSMLNPIYLFYAYLVEDIERHEKTLIQISEDAKTAMKEVGTEFTGFGGAMEKDDLEDYRYKIMMPYFTDPTELKEFDSFENGLKTIQENLAKGKGKTVKVYELVFPDKQIAVFGVGLLCKEEGEAHFLPIIGEENIAAMPYDMILQGNTVTMLPGRYRFALHWPELTMGTFMKIMSTPGDVEDLLKGLTEKE